MPELPLSHITLGNPGAVWPKQSSYNAFYQDPKVRVVSQLATNQAATDDELDAQILEAINQVIGEVQDPLDKPHSENSNPTVYEIVSETVETLSQPDAESVAVKSKLSLKKQSVKSIKSIKSKQSAFSTFSDISAIKSIKSFAEKQPSIFDSKSLTSRAFSLKSSRQDQALKTLTVRAIHNQETTSASVDIKHKF